MEFQRGGLPGPGTRVPNFPLLHLRPFHDLALAQALLIELGINMERKNQMTRKLNQTLFAGMSAFLVAGAFGSVASADVGIGQASVLTVNKATNDDLARVQTPQNGGSPYLRKTDEEFTNEMHVAAFSGKKGISIEMRSGSLQVNGAAQKPGGNGQRMQGACAPLELTLNGSAVEAKKNAGERFLTANNGNEYRNFNHPEVEPLTEGTATQPALFMVLYNAQLNSNDTKKYAVVVDENCNIVPMSGGQNGQAAPNAQNPGVVVMAKNNDDCSMNQDGGSGTMVQRGTDEVQFGHWAGCNGNGADDGWFNSFTIKVTRDASGKATGARVTKQGDVSVAAQEERSRGRCSSVAGVPNFAFCTYNQGNNQPQREGTWAAGINMPANAAPTIQWTKQIEGRKNIEIAPGKTARTYSSRVMHSPILDGNLENTNKFILRTGDLQGNNQNNRKGGTYLTFQTGIVTVGKDGMTWDQTMTNVQSKIAGTDGTHLVMAPAIFGSSQTPGVLFLQGTHTSAPGQVASARIMTMVNGKVEVEAGAANVGAPYGRHLYSNYLGNNPGNQGRGFAKVFAHKNPFYGEAGNKDKVLLIASTNGKDGSQPESMYKESTYVSVIPVVTDAAGAPAPGTGGGNGGGGGNGQGGNGGNTGGEDGDTSVGGCSTGSGSAGLASLLLLGLVAFRRRRA